MYFVINHNTVGLDNKDMDEITISLFSKICRFCLKQSNKLKIISEMSSIDIFRKITGIESSRMLPQKICSSCTKIFQTFLSFVEKAKDNIYRLTNIYEEAQQDKFDSFNINTESENDIFSEDHIAKDEDVIEDVTNYDNDVIRNNEQQKKNKTTLKTIICKKCKLTFSSQAEFTTHCKDGFICQPMDYKCLVCNKMFKRQHRLKNHMRSHTKEAPYKCTECPKTFRFQQNLRRHILIHKGIKKFKCEDCGKAFSRAHVLNEHRNIHTGHNPFICDYCGKGFKRYANHFIHVYRHKLLNGEVDQTEDSKLYLQLQCNICNKIFASRGSLENHLKLHQEEPREKKFLCTDCGKGFITNAQLVSHMRMHTGDRPFECNQCGKKFKQKSAYSNHQSVHSGTKPYQCKQCNRLFSQAGHLKVHMRVHSGEKPFTCNFCGKNFALKSNLTVHIRTHTGEKPYVCLVCSKGYYDSTSLKKHTQRCKPHDAGLPSHGYLESE